jgi:DNA-binding MarR family transcriptional regulator
MCVPHANKGSGDPDHLPGAAPVRERPHLGDRELEVTRLDHTLQRMRRVVLRPPGVGIPIPGLGRPVDIAKVLACEAISDLLEQQDPVTVTDVATAMQLERSTVSRLLGECESEGLITRTPVPGDGRRVGLSITADGTRAVAGSALLRAQFLEAVTERFSDDDLTMLVALLERFADNLTEMFPHWLVSTDSAVTDL